MLIKLPCSLELLIFFFFLNVFPIALAGNFGETQSTDCGHGNELACYQGELVPGEYVGKCRGSLHHGMVPIFLFSPLLSAGDSYPPFKSASSPLLKLECCLLHEAKVVESWILFFKLLGWGGRGQVQGKIHYLQALLQTLPKLACPSFPCRTAELCF